MKLIKLLYICNVKQHTQQPKQNTMKAYKGFNHDLTCMGKKYEEGKTYENDKAILCKEGFHACENPIGCLHYYSPAQSVYHEVELEGVSDERSDDSKVVAKKITVGAKIGVPAICQLTFEYVKSHCTNENNAEVGKPATAGDRGAATAGNYGAATAGYRGAATAGDRGAATAGDYGTATSRGFSASGEDGLSVARGNNAKVKGGIGALLVIAEERRCSYDIKEWKAVVVDGETIKADTWYQLIDGELKEL